MTCAEAEKERDAMKTAARRRLAPPAKEEVKAHGEEAFFVHRCRCVPDARLPTSMYTVTCPCCAATTAGAGSVGDRALTVIVDAPVANAIDTAADTEFEDAPDPSAGFRPQIRPPNALALLCRSDMFRPDSTCC